MKERHQKSFGTSIAIEDYHAPIIAITPHLVPPQREGRHQSAGEGQGARVQCRSGAVQEKDTVRGGARGGVGPAHTLPSAGGAPLRALWIQAGQLWNPRQEGRLFV